MISPTMSAAVARIMRRTPGLICGRCLRPVNWLRVSDRWQGCDHCGYTERFPRQPRNRPWKIAR